MLAQASVTIPYRSDAVSAALMAPEQARSFGLDGDGGALLARVGIKIGKLEVYKHVHLHIGVSDAARRHDRVMLPVSWEATGGPPIFPRMEGTLHAEPDGPASTRLTLNARYDPPLGALGGLLDRAGMHRVAQITMTDFVERLAQALEPQLSRGR